MKFTTVDSARRQVDSALSIIELFAGVDFKFDFVIAELTGHHPTVRNHVSDRVYYFLEGQATVHVGDTQFTVSSGDLVPIKAGTPHGLNGHARYIIVTAPPFSPSNEEIVAT